MKTSKKNMSNLLILDLPRRRTAASTDFIFICMAKTRNKANDNSRNPATTLSGKTSLYISEMIIISINFVINKVISD